MIAELVMDAGGVIVPPPSYFPRLRQICDCHDVLLIADARGDSLCIAPLEVTLNRIMQIVGESIGAAQ
jgi:hypothetical protein